MTKSTNVKKFKDLLKNTEDYESRINVLIYDAAKWLRGLGKNDIKHSNNIEDYLNRLVPDEIKENEDIFDKAEIFFLLYAVYLHDIGRIYGEKGHEKKTRDMINDLPYSTYKLNDVHEASVVAEICYGHAKESENPIEFISSEFGIAGHGNRPLNLQFLAALLRLADEVDNAYLRVEGIRDQKGSVRNLVRYISFDNSEGIIIFWSNHATPEDRDKLDKMQNDTQMRLDEIKGVLIPKGLKYEKILVDPDTYKKIVPNTKIKLLETRKNLNSLLCKVLEKRIKNGSVTSEELKHTSPEKLEHMSLHHLIELFLIEYSQYKRDYEYSFKHVRRICNKARDNKKVLASQASEALKLGTNLIVLLEEIVKNQESPTGQN